MVSASSPLMPQVTAAVQTFMSLIVGNELGVEQPACRPVCHEPVAQVAPTVDDASDVQGEPQPTHLGNLPIVQDRVVELYPSHAGAFFSASSISSASSNWVTSSFFLREPNRSWYLPRIVGTAPMCSRAMAHCSSVAGAS